MHQILPPPRRRTVLAGLALLTASTTLARAQSALDAAAHGVTGDTGEDQSQSLQDAIDQAARAGQILRLPPGVIIAQGLVLPGNLMIEGVPGRTNVQSGGDVIARASGISGLVLRDVIFSGGTVSDIEALLSIAASDAVTLERCAFSSAPVSALIISDSAATIRDCAFADIGDAAIYALDSRGLLITGNRIQTCGNAGIRIWRSENGADGSIVTANRIARIDWRGGGNGQNGNGINVFKADEVIVADNHIADCAFTAIRLNSTNNTQVSGNTCLRSGEVAIFSEFAFSGSIISGNIVDTAATGISMTNLDSGGQLAVCSGNIVRNITSSSAVNPDTMPIGIFAEAEAAITGNTIQNVPGTALMAGYGTFLRNVLIAGNVVSDSDIGVGVSVVDGAGAVTIANNAIQARQHAIVGLAWTDIVETDLAAGADRYPNVTLN